MIFKRRPPAPEAPPPEVPEAPSSGGHGTTFQIASRIGRATGPSSRYASDAVRVLPAVEGEQVILQATDGRQAVCIVQPGHARESKLVPPEVLPTRRVETTVRFAGDRWESSEGRMAPAHADGSFPPIGDVLPDIGSRAFTVTPAMVREAGGATHVVLGIDLDLLRKQAEALGTYQLTLFIPVPMHKPGDKPQDVVVSKPICICAAKPDEGVNGIGAVMPLSPARTTDYYRDLRQLIVASERRLEARSRRQQTRDGSTRTPGSPGSPGNPGNPGNRSHGDLTHAQAQGT